MPKLSNSISVPLFKVFMPPEAKSMMMETLDSGFLAEGTKVKQFASKISDFIGSPYVVPTNSCTSSLTIAFKLAGVTEGSEVISTPLTCVAGNEPVRMLGGKIVWADVDISTGMLTADSIKPHINSNTKAIYLLHKEGSPADVDSIYALAHSNGLRVIEDAAHAFGAQKDGKRIGSFGDLVCFSFQAIKHITTGDGGALVCPNNDDYMRAKKLKWFGIDRDARTGRDVWREDITDWGLKANMNDIAGTLGLAQMNHIDWILDKFHTNGRRYDLLFSDIPGVGVFKRDINDFQTYWGYTILVNNRSQVQTALAENGIASSQIHVRNDHYSMFGSSASPLPNTDWIDQRELSLPCGWWIDEPLQDKIINIVSQTVQ